MKKWTVYGTGYVAVTCEVEANSEAEAIAAAEDKFPDLVNFAGNGGYDYLVGTDDEDVHLDGGGVEYDSAECNE